MVWVTTGVTVTVVVIVVLGLLMERQLQAVETWADAKEATQGGRATSRLAGAVVAGVTTGVHVVIVVAALSNDLVQERDFLDLGMQLTLSL